MLKSDIKSKNMTLKHVTILSLILIGQLVDEAVM